MARVIPQLNDLMVAIMGPLVTVGEIVYIHIFYLCPEVDMDEMLSTVSHEVADLAE